MSTPIAVALIRPDCSTCTSGYAETVTYTCKECLNDGDQLILAFFVFSIIAVVAVIVILYLILKINAGSAEPPSKLNAVLDHVARFVPLHGLKIIIVTWQILTQVS